MPEKVTREEKIIELTIQKAREVKALRDGLTKDEMPTVEKIKRPKAQASKHGITQDKENANAGGEVFTNKLKKAKFSGPPQQRNTFITGPSKNADYILRIAIKNVHNMLEQAMDTMKSTDSGRILRQADLIDIIRDVKDVIKRSLKEIDKADEVLLDAAKYGSGDSDGMDRLDSKYLSTASTKYSQNKNFE